MYFPEKDVFAQKAKPGFLIPVYKELEIGEENPFTAYLKIKEGDYSFLLESGRVDGKLGCFSFVGSKPLVAVRSKGFTTELVYHDGGKKTIEGQPLKILKEVMGQYPGIRTEGLGLPLFYGGAVGYLSYDMGRFFEVLPEWAEDDLQIPELYFMLVDTVLIFDHLRGKLQLVANVQVEDDLDKAYDQAIAKIEALEAKLAVKLEREPFILPKNPELADLAIESNFTKEAFEAGVEKIVEYIKAGDVFQVNVSQRLATPITVDPLVIYEVMRQINPSPFGGFLDYGEMQIVSCSPERLIRLENGRATTRPIAGTRPRGKTEEEDLALEDELINNIKERAEHIMLVDLERNDLGRACVYGTVQVDELMIIERYSHVMHIVSNVVGELSKEKDCFDLTKATFPGGTITGAPKIRCMEIIEEVEPVRRGPYTGSFGYYNFAGDMDLNIIIRTIVVKDGKAYAQAGAGIVYDSVPEREYYETLFKAEAMLKSIKIVEGGRK